MVTIEISQYLYDYLKEQLHALYDKRESLKNDFSEALELGDEVENAPLDAATQAIEINESRIRELESLIKNFHASVRDKRGVVTIGTVFIAQNKDTGEVSNFILGTPDLSAFVPTNLRLLSTSTILGQSVLGRKVGETFTANTSLGMKVYKIVKVLHG